MDIKDFFVINIHIQILYKYIICPSSGSIWQIKHTWRETNKIWPKNNFRKLLPFYDTIKNIFLTSMCRYFLLHGLQNSWNHFYFNFCQHYWLCKCVIIYVYLNQLSLSARSLMQGLCRVGLVSPWRGWR